MKRQKLVSKVEVEKVIRHYKPLLGLADWSHSLTMDMSKVGDTISAAVAVPEERRFAIVFAPRVYAAVTDRCTTLHGTIIHELLHVALWPLLTACAGEESARLDWVTTWIEEPIVDPLSRTLARYLPRPR